MTLPKFPSINQELLNQLRGLFFSKDQSVVLPTGGFIGLRPMDTPDALPPFPYRWIYPKADGNLYILDYDGNEEQIGGGVSTFLGLSDTPASYVGESNSYVKVNNLATALEFTTGGIELIGQTTLTGSAASVTFDLTDYQQFRHLLLVGNARTDRASTNDAIYWQANGDTGNNYDRHYMGAVNATFAASPTISTSAGWASIAEAANSLANAYAPIWVIFENYTSTSFHKFSNATVSLFGTPAAATSISYSMNSRWKISPITAITSLTLVPATGPNFVTNSTFALYGVY